MTEPAANPAPIYYMIGDPSTTVPIELLTGNAPTCGNFTQTVAYIPPGMAFDFSSSELALEAPLGSLGSTTELVINSTFSFDNPAYPNETYLNSYPIILVNGSISYITPSKIEDITYLVIYPPLTVTFTPFNNTDASLTVQYTLL